MKRIASNALWLVGDRVLRLPASLVATILLIRHLGPEDFGIYAFGLSFVGVVGVIPRLGMNKIVVRMLQESGKDAGRILGTATALRLPVAAVCYGLCLVAAFLTPIGHTSVARLVIGVLGLRLFADTSRVVEWWFEAQIRQKYVVWARNAGLWVLAVAQVVLVVLGADVVAFATAFAAAGFLTALLHAGVWLKWGPSDTRWDVDLSSARKLLAESWPMLVHAGATIVYLKVDQVMLGTMTSSDEVGIYASAARLSEFWLIVPSAIAVSVFPRIVQLMRGDRPSPDLGTKLQRFYDTMAVQAVIVCIVILVGAAFLVDVLYGEAYAGAAKVLQIHVVSLIFLSCEKAGSKELIARGLQRYLMVTALTGAAINVGLNLILIPVSGAVGAAVATSVSYAFSGFLAFAIWEETRPVFRRIVRGIGAAFRPGRVADVLRGLSDYVGAEA